MRSFPLLFALLSVVVLGACASTPDAKTFPAAQEIVDAVAAKHPELTRLTLHAVPTGTDQCLQIASTMPERRGKPSDPEDLEALRTNKEVVLDEQGAIDVTMPILMKDRVPTAVTGVTLRAEPGAERQSLLTNARAIAWELENAIRAAGKPLW